MKKLNIVLFILLIACTFINIIAFRNGLITINSVTKNVGNLDLLNVERKSALFSYFDNGQTLNPNIVFSTEKSSYLTKVFINNNIKSTKLVFRYAEVNCNACVDSSILKLKKFSAIVKDTNIIILASVKLIMN